MPAASHSSSTCWSTTFPPTGSSSFGTTLVSGRRRVPRPAAGRIALRIVAISSSYRLLYRTPTIREGRCPVDEHAVSRAGISPLVAPAVHAAGGAGHAPRGAAPAGGRGAGAGKLLP